MEDAIVNNPEKFLKEKGLKLLARQYRVGSYIFDLLFEDRHGGKLIVELQKGTLDRTHTFKILDYYHEFKEKNPRDFIDVMVIANVIPPERKRRLNDLGVDYQEISASMFIENQPEILNVKKENKADQLFVQNSKNIKMAEGRKRFKSKGTSAFMKITHVELIKVANSNWDIKGDVSFKAKHKPTIETIEKKYGKGFNIQMWMERPKNGSTRCKFEVADKIPSLNDGESKKLRKEIAASLRSIMVGNGLQKDIEEATGSTVIATKINLPKIQAVEDDIDKNIDKNEIHKIIDLYEFLDKKLNEWNNLNHIKLIEI